MFNSGLKSSFEFDFVRFAFRLLPFKEPIVTELRNFARNQVFVMAFIEFQNYLEQRLVLQNFELFERQYSQLLSFVKLVNC